MRIDSLPALIFLLFAFSFPTHHHLTLAVPEQVLDIHKDPLVSGQQYHILDASDHSRGVQTEELDPYNCSITVIVGSDPKKVTFTAVDGETSITTEQELYIEFSEVSPCAGSGNWIVALDDTRNYSVLIGSPAGVIPLAGSFRITKSEALTDAYNLAFLFQQKIDYFLVTKNYRPHQDVYQLDLCAEKGYDVVFYPYSPPTLTHQNHVPRIRKRVA